MQNLQEKMYSLMYLQARWTECSPFLATLFIVTPPPPLPGLARDACVSHFFNRASPLACFDRVARQSLLTDALFRRGYRRQRFEKTNEKLDSFNDLSSHRLVSTLQDFRKHTHLLVEARKDLHSIFRRIR